MNVWPKGLWLAAILLVLALGGPGRAQEQKNTKLAANSNGGITREQADAILNELLQIRLLVGRIQAQQPFRTSQPVAAAPEKAKLAIREGFWLGRADAPLTMIEYTDYQCHYCRSFHLSTFPELKKNYIDTGKMRFIARDFPLDFHRNAMRAAQAVRCAGEQDKFWPMRDTLITNADKLGQESLLSYAQQLNLDLAKFRGCLDSQKYQAEIQRDIREGEGLGVSGTPTFVIGRSTKDAVEGVLLEGAQPYARFEAKIKELLAQG